MRVYIVGSVLIWQLALPSLLGAGPGPLAVAAFFWWLWTLVNILGRWVAP